MNSNSNFTLSDAQFNRLRELLQKRTGLAISSSRKKELQKRIAPFIHQHHDIDQLIRKLDSSYRIDQGLVNALTIGESYFFRNHPHFEALKKEVFPSLIARKRERKRIKIWSAGCSTGEEPYSLSILVDRDFPVLKDWDITILASDINTSFLKRAEEAKYTQWSFRGVDESTISRYFAQTGKNEFTLNEDIKKRVSFQQLNLSTLP
ncbi:MAG: protein-glutamate O-methyltransferase, partial [Deltaproteobacteria bacterium]|nr:protein-glutamate O-methyltransferase [Deltaproteobacteria bacterium]